MLAVFFIQALKQVRVWLTGKKMLAALSFTLIIATVESILIAIAGILHPNIPEANGVPIYDVAWFKWFCTNWMFVHFFWGIIAIRLLLNESSFRSKDPLTW